MIKIAINGFGRIGRLCFRETFGSKEFEVVAINDLTDAHTLAHLLKYDTAQKRYEGHTIESNENSIIVDGKSIRIYAEKDPNNLPWKDLEVDVVFECTGFFTKKDDAIAHINAGAKKVIISAPAKGDVKTVVFGVNEDILDGSEEIISAASCTTNCLAPLAKVMHDNFTIKYGTMTTIHAYTNDQNTLDSPHRKGDLRRARAAAENIVPNSTGAAKAIGLVIPELAGKLDGSAQRVPVPTGSLVELVCVLDKKVTKEEVNAAMKASANDTLGYTEDEIVSSDVIGIRYGSLFDATQTKIVETEEGQLVKVVSWYDNEMSYTCQMIRTAKYLMKR